MKETDLDAVKDIALAFLYLPIRMTEFSPLIIEHPMFSSGIIYSTSKNNMVDITENEDDLAFIRDEISNTINKYLSVECIRMLITKQYRFVFFKYIRRYLSRKDFAVLLAKTWVESENPNQDANVDSLMAISWFKIADKNFMMSEDELNVFNNLPENLTIYRGVGVGRKKMGLSWTENYIKAVWFAGRFNRDGKQGYVLKAEINKNGILAYFNSRNEDELVVDTMYLKNIETIKPEMK
jgi:hypothetical protein